MKKLLLAALFLTSTALAGGGQPLTSSQPFIWPAAWSDAKPGEAKYGGMYREVAAIIETLNPFRNQDMSSPVFKLAEGTGLFRQSPADGRWLPYMAAAEPTVSEGGKVFTIRLRRGMKFSDGVEVTARDFVTTWKIHADKAMKSASYGQFYSGDQPITMKALDNYTLQASFPVPMATAPRILSFAPWPDHVFGPVYAKGGAAAVAAMWSKNMNPGEFVSAGPWTLAQNHSEPGGHIILKRNAYWGEWNKDSLGRALPYLDGVDLKVIPDEVTVFDSFLAGESDRTVVATANQIKAMQEAMATSKVKAELLLNVSPRNSMSYLIFNWNRASDPYKQALFRNATFRQAMSSLYDRQKVIDQTLGGQGKAMYSQVPLLFPEYIPADLPKFDYNPTRAAKLLAELGYTRKDSEGYLVNADGKRIEFDLMTYPDPQSKAEVAIFVADAKAAGVKVNLPEIDIDDMWARVDGDPKTPDERNFDAVRYADTGFEATFPFMDYVWRCDGSGHAFNMSGECISPDEQRINDLFVQGTRELDPAKRAALGRQLNSELGRFQGMIPLITYAYNVAYSKRLGGALPRNLMNAYNGIRYLPLTFVK